MIETGALMPTVLEPICCDDDGDSEPPAIAVLAVKARRMRSIRPRRALAAA